MPYWQLSPHQDFASETQRLSQAVLQQYGSEAHTVEAHEEQVLTSLAPVVHSLCEQLEGGGTASHTLPLLQV